MPFGKRSVENLPPKSSLPTKKCLRAPASSDPRTRVVSKVGPRIRPESEPCGAAWATAPLHLSSWARRAPPEGCPHLWAPGSPEKGSQIWGSMGSLVFGTTQHKMRRHQYVVGKHDEECFGIQPPLDSVAGLTNKMNPKMKESTESNQARNPK